MSTPGVSSLDGLINLPTFSIIILAFNSIKYIRNCLITVFETEYSKYEVILVDNGSSDDSANVAKALFGERPNFRLIRSSANLGFAGGNDFGAKVAKGDVLVFLNADCEVSGGWLNKLSLVFAQHQEIGIVQPKLLQLEDKQVFDSIGDIVDYFGDSTSLAGDWEETDRGQYDYPREIFSARGAALAIRKEVFRRLGGFDESFFLDYEDIDLCWRARLAGHKVVYLPDSVVFHAGASGGTAERVKTRGYHPFKNKYSTLIKNYELANLVRYLVPDILLFDSRQIVSEALTGETKLALSRARGMLWVLFNLRSVLSKRASIQTHLRKIPDSKIQRFMIETSLTRKQRYGFISQRVTLPPAKRWYAKPIMDRIELFRMLL